MCLKRFKTKGPAPNMFESLTAFLMDWKMDSHPLARRIYERRSTDTCISQIGENVYPVENWSKGGVLISGDNKFLGAGQTYDVTLRFRMRDRIMNVTQKARIIRMTGEKTAFQFLPLAKEVANAFQQVVDDAIASQFANSQA